MIRRPTQQLEHMLEARVRPGWSARRPTESIEAEINDEKRSKK